MSSITLKDVNQHEFVICFAAFIKKSGKLALPDWADLVKNGKFKELAPYDKDWFYTRCAATLRRMYFRSPASVGSLIKIFGGRKRNGVKPAHHCHSSSGIARKVLQSLEQMKLIEKDAVNGGRRLTPQGRRDMDRIAAQMKQAQMMKKKKKNVQLIVKDKNLFVLVPKKD